MFNFSVMRVGILSNSHYIFYSDFNKTTISSAAVAFSAVVVERLDSFAPPTTENRCDLPPVCRTDPFLS